VEVLEERVHRVDAASLPVDKIGSVLEIVDAHQHFWDPERNYHPWLRDEPPIPFRYGDYRALRRRYLPPHYLADASGCRVLGTVYVESEWDPRDPLGEMRYVASLRSEFGLPTVAVAQAWLDRGDVPRQLEALAAFPFVRGVRHKPAPGAMDDARWRAGFAALGARGLRFDLQAPWSELGAAARLAGDFPGAQIVLDHAGLPADRSEAGIAGWREAMRRLAACPNVAVKISGLGQPGRRWTAAANGGIVRAVIDLFGVARCMFASNFPVDSLCASFAEIYAAFDAITAGFSAAERRALFAGNARRLYGMETT
jgi:predicted TIM-barrel fold metal-dependent hydrolase